MPEGDILRRTARSLDRALGGELVAAAELRWPSAGSVDLVGRAVLGVEAYGKHLFMRFDDGRTLHTHLRMEGSWALEPTRAGTPAGRRRGPWVRAIVATARWTAIGERLGMLDLVRTRDEHTLIAHLGPDILAAGFPLDGLASALDRYRERGSTPVGEVLLDQTVVAGIGTIYMAESLHARRLWPWTPADEVSDPASLLMTARVLMERSVAAQDAGVAPGTGTWLARRVHGRAGKPCARCGERVAVGQVRQAPMSRPAFYCPGCQAPA